MSRLRRPFLSDRYFFITGRLLRRHVKLAAGIPAVLMSAVLGAATSTLTPNGKPADRKVGGLRYA
ncbi:MAG: hypothetical protein M1404_03675 [Acidobacteria bacterium]|nr:hypothetical protein [Acidobacteriota bacterium]